MAYSTLVLYQDCKITPDKNCYVDSLNQYLLGLKKRAVNNFQYIKDLSLDLTIKVNLGQEYSNKPTYNYVRIYNSDNDRHFFYFVMECNWKSENTVELVLSMDTINTFQDKLTFLDTTSIIRQHKDRFKERDSDTSFSAVRVVDKVDEGVNGVVMKKNSSSRITGDKYYLIYTSDEDTGVSCYLTKESNFITRTTGSSYVLDYDTVASTDVYVIEYSRNLASSFNYTYNSTTTTLTLNSTTSYRIVRRPQAGATTLDIYLIYNSTGNDSYIGQADYITFPTEIKALLGEINSFIDPYQNSLGSDWYEMQKNLSDSYVVTLGPSGTAFTIAGIANWDRTRSEIVKIIECPYCPIANIDYALDNGWTYKPLDFGINGATINALKLKDLTMSFTNTIQATTNIDNTTCTIPTKADRYAAAKNSTYESKLFNSNFYTDKYVYDSFSNEVRHEDIEPSSNISIPKVLIKYIQSSNISSNLLYNFTYTSCTYKQNEDFENMLICTRNNEYPIYNNAYIEYLRNGYNYDVKAKNQQTTFNWIGTGVQAIGAVAAFAASSVTGGVSAAAGISLLTSTVASIASNINNTVTQENAIQQKLDQAKAQSASVTNADDLSLLNYYCGNKMLHNTYTISDNLKNQLFDLFYRCGYAVSTTGTPDTTSRRSFNYVQCNPVFSTEADPEWLEYINDVKQRFSAGVTYMHRFQTTNGGTYTYDWLFQKENWETWLCPRTYEE